MNHDLDTNTRDHSHTLWLQGVENSIIYDKPLEGDRYIKVLNDNEILPKGDYDIIQDFNSNQVRLEPRHG